MTVQCAKCGEELLGSVNRCWRCGHEFVSRSGPAELPPVRRAPVNDLFAGLVAEPVADEPLADEPLADEPEESRPTPADRWSRRGSPFAAQGGASGAEVFAPDPGPRLPNYPRDGGAIGGAVVAIALGVIGLGLAFVFPPGALIVSFLGLVMGIWGVYSRRRGAAIAGLLICCLAFATAGFNGAVELYTYVHGVSPFQTFVPVTVQE